MNELSSQVDKLQGGDGVVKPKAPDTEIPAAESPAAESKPDTTPDTAPPPEPASKPQPGDYDARIEACEKGLEVRPDTDRMPSALGAASQPPTSTPGHHAHPPPPTTQAVMVKLSQEKADIADLDALRKLLAEKADKSELDAALNVRLGDGGL